ncbi:MAG: hypothetical protein IJX97_03900 [Clostridia bacterium]|nr:hypothetical protein [Clostridia bacterium]MBQ8720115.1 hypothetical protein [Clostridia bacterium]
MDFNKKIPEIEAVIEYTFKDKSLLRQAFTRKSYSNEHLGRGGVKIQSNEVFEFFGDGILSAAIISFMIRDSAERYEYGIRTELEEGDFTNVKSKLSDKKNLSRCMNELGLQRYLLMGEGDEKLGIENQPSVMEDLFESIIAAIYVDCGMNMETVMRSVAVMLDVDSFISSKAVIQSYKNELQEWCADKCRRLPAPTYETVSETGPEHKRVFERACYIGGVKWGVGVGKNRKIADSAAAEAALAALIEDEEMKKCAANESAISELRTYAARNKKPSASFRDLGEEPCTTGERYAVECRFDGLSVKGVGISKKAARAAAAALMMESVRKTTSEPKEKKTKKAKAEKPAKAAPTKKKSSAKSASPKSKEVSTLGAKGGKPKANGKRQKTAKK